MKIVAAIIGSALLAAACSDKPPANPSTATMAGESTVGTTTPAPAQPQPTIANTTPASHDTTPPYAETEQQIGTDTTSSSMTDTSRNAKSTPYATTGVSNPAPEATDTTPPKKADNTAQNVRDRHDTVTSGDQGNSKDEVKITASIRKQLVASKMSFNAKNAKVITTGTKVTLRGPVKTDEEKAQIEALARGTAGVTDVDNQLEVKK
jgi:hypothetical protein